MSEQTDYQWTMICKWCKIAEHRVTVFSLTELQSILERSGWEYLSGEWLCPDCVTEYWTALDDSVR